MADHGKHARCVHQRHIICQPACHRSAAIRHGGIAGGEITISASISGSPAPTSIEWLRNGVPLTNGAIASGSVISNAGTAALTITGITLADAENYIVRATNTVDTTNSSVTQLSVSASSGGAFFTPYGLDNTTGGVILTGSAPAKAMVGISTPATFTASGGLRYLPNIPANYCYYGAINQSGTKILLGNQTAVAPMMVYDLAAESGNFLPPVSFPIGPVASASSVLPSVLSDKGDAAAVITGPDFQLYAFHDTAPSVLTPAQIALGDFLAGANVPENLRGPLDDPNGDGVSNLLAFALGLPPMAPAVLPAATSESGVLALPYTRAQSAHVSYSVRTFTDLGAAVPRSASGVSEGTPDENGVTTATLPITAAPGFLRIEVSLIPWEITPLGTATSGPVLHRCCSKMECPGNSTGDRDGSELGLSVGRDQLV